MTCKINVPRNFLIREQYVAALNIKYKKNLKTYIWKKYDEKDLI